MLPTPSRTRRQPPPAVAPLPRGGRLHLQRQPRRAVLGLCLPLCLHSRHPWRASQERTRRPKRSAVPQPARLEHSQHPREPLPLEVSGDRCRRAARRRAPSASGSVAEALFSSPPSTRVRHKHSGMFHRIYGGRKIARTTGSHRAGFKIGFRGRSKHRLRDQNGGGGAGNRTRVRSRVKRDIYECSPGFVLTGATPWDQAPYRPVTVYVPPAAVTPAGGEAAGISVGSGHRSRSTGRRQAVARAFALLTQRAQGAVHSSHLCFSRFYEPGARLAITQTTTPSKPYAPTR